jgi:cytochrome b561
MDKYLISQRAFHWLSALLILGLFGLGVWMRTLGYYDSWYQTGPEIHKAIGILTAVLIIARLMWRVKTDTPKPLSSHKYWEVMLSHLVHRIMYGFIFVILISGYLISTADNRGIDVFGLFEVPAIITAFEKQEDIAGLIHEWVAYGLIALVTLHVAGALKHHFIDKDSTLKRML